MFYTTFVFIHVKKVVAISESHVIFFFFPSTTKPVLGVGWAWGVGWDGGYVTFLTLYFKTLRTESHSVKLHSCSGPVRDSPGLNCW